MLYVPSQKLVYIGGGCSAPDGYGNCSGGPLSVSWGPNANVTVSLTASDGRGGSTLLTLPITVTNVNRAPAIAHHSDVTVGENSTFTVVTSASDLDGNSLTYGFSAAPAGLALTQGSGAAANSASVTAAFGSLGTYTISATASDGLALATDTFKIVVQAAQVRPVPNAGGAAPVLADGILALDTKYNQLVFYDAARAPDTVYLMALKSDPSTQTWTVKTFPPSGCASTYCYPPNSSASTTAQGVTAPLRGALFVFRSFAGNSAAPDDDVWRLDLNPATALTAAWTRVSTANPYVGGCGQYLPGPFRSPLIYSSAADAIFREHVGAQAANAGGWNAGPLTLFAHATTGAAMTAAFTIYQYAWAASNTKAWVLLDDSAAAPLTRVAEVTPGPTSAPSTSVNLAAVSPPAATLGAGLAVDTLLQRAFVFGGKPRIGSGSASDDLYRFDFGSGAWTQLVPNSPRPAPRTDPRMVFVPSQKLLYVGGGCTGTDGYGRCSGSTLSDLWTLNLDPSSGGL